MKASGGIWHRLGHSEECGNIEHREAFDSIWEYLGAYGNLRLDEIPSGTKGVASI